MAISSANTSLRAGICTSTTRPSNPYLGQLIFETDTFVMNFWNGSSWGSLNPTANRNVIINGAFNVWQRGTSKAMATGGGTGYIADRWTAARSGYAAGGTVSRQTASLGGFQYCSRVQRDSGNTSTAVVYYFQTLESVTSIPLANNPVAYSFYIRAGANFSGSIAAKLYSGTATDQINYPDSLITGSATVITSTLSLTTSWQRVTLFGNVGATATQLFAGFEWAPSGTAGASDFFEITGVQLEVGNQASAFEQRLYGTELALCQRYYYKNTTAPNNQVGVGMIYATNSAITVNKFPVPMRIAPTSATITGLTAGIDSGGTGRGFGASAYNQATTEDVSLVHTGGFNFTLGAACYVYAQAVGWNYAVSAEL